MVRANVDVSAGSIAEHAIDEDVFHVLRVRNPRHVRSGLKWACCRHREPPAWAPELRSPALYRLSPPAGRRSTSAFARAMRDVSA
jgi:hypothetical protein